MSSNSTLPEHTKDFESFMKALVSNTDASAASTASSSNSTLPASAISPQPTSSSPGRQCSRCKTLKQRSDYSKSQWEQPSKSRKCASCVSTVVNSTNSTPTPDPTSASSASSSSTSTSQSTPDSTALPLVDKNNQPKRDANGKLLHHRKPKLLDDKGDWLSPKCERVLREIFASLDSDHDGAWDEIDIQRFAMATNGKPFTEKELLDIRENLTVDAQGRWTLNGFLDFYHLQTQSHPNETWKDLRKLGYDNRLLLKNQQ